MKPTTSTKQSPFTTPWHRGDGQQIRALFRAGLLNLEQKYEHVNQLNVFPIPDGDTGTNMLVTLRKAYAAIADETSDDAATVADLLARGALMEARGNSGVILSQILRGLADGLAGEATFDSEQLANAFLAAANKAYGAVSDPTEGTILTVMRTMAETAVSTAPATPNLHRLFTEILASGEVALAHTPEQLPILKQSGVVDSGGQGLIYILQGMVMLLNGEQIEGEIAQTVAKPAQAHAVPKGGQIENPYDVQFLLMGSGLDVEQVRHAIEQMGDSTVVVGDPSLIKVHVHVKNPGEPLSYAVGLGSVSDVVVENMQMQMEAIVGAARPHDDLLDGATVTQGQIGVVAVASGRGIAQIFASARAAKVVLGGQTNNPSVETLLAAIESTPTDKIILLPNNKNIIMTAEQAANLSDKTVIVVPTKTMPQGLSSMFGLVNLEDDVQETAVSMQSFANSVTTAEITRATRTVTLDGVAVQEGDVIGLVNGRIVVAGVSITAVLPTLLAAMQPDEIEIIAIYYGNAVSLAEAEAFQAEIETLYPHIDSELHDGGQSHYDYILGAE